MVDCSEKRKALRAASGLKQEQVAKRIGVSKAMVSAYETASKAPSVEMFVRLAQLFGVSVDYLVRVDEPKLLEVSGLDDESMVLISALIQKLRRLEE